MIVLDTNVISEAIKSSPHPHVRAWLDVQSPETLFISSITVAEIRFGLGILPEGKRKAVLAAVLDSTFDLFSSRTLVFDIAAAQSYADLAIRARASGRGLPTPDGYIAAIAAAHGFGVASRDTSPFRAAGLAVVDPWFEAS